MANRKISDLTALTTPASGDYLPIVDISEAADADKNKRITIEELMRGAPDGTAAAPGIAFEGDPDTGLYRVSANAVGISAGGTQQLLADSSGVQTSGDVTINGITVGRGGGAVSTNTTVGSAALGSNTTAAGNTATGFAALNAATTGGSNTGCGWAALYNVTTGINNTGVGVFAGRYTVAGTDNANYTNCSYLGYDTRASGDNQVQLGDSNTTTYVFGTVQNRSDARDKADVRDTVLGLDFINSLRPVDFRWDYRDAYFDSEEYEGEDGTTQTRLVPVPKDGSRKRNRFHHGLIAQEVKAAMDAAGVDFGGYQDHGHNGGDDVLSVGYVELIGPMIKALQEAAARIETLEATVAALGGNGS